MSSVLYEQIVGMIQKQAGNYWLSACGSRPTPEPRAMDRASWPSTYIDIFIIEHKTATDHWPTERKELSALNVLRRDRRCVL